MNYLLISIVFFLSKKIILQKFRLLISKPNNSVMLKFQDYVFFDFYNSKHDVTDLLKNRTN